MKKWEDIIKEELLSYESPIPSYSAPKKLAPWPWSFAAATAAAASVVVLLSLPGRVSHDIVPVTLERKTPSLTVSIPIPGSLIPIARDIRSTRDYIPATPATPVAAELAAAAEDAEPPGTAAPVQEEYKKTSAPASAGNVTVRTNMVPALCAVAGGSILASALLPPAGVSAGQIGQSDCIATSGITGNGELKGVECFFPLRAGASLRFPVSKSLNVTTGIDYSCYRSSFDYSVSGRKNLLAHYLGIPLRLDWTMASGKWFEVYVGAGVEADWCVGARLAGVDVVKDGMGLSLIGAGGMQVNLSDHMGLFIEPEISWTAPSDKRVLETYRKQHPLMFSVNGGIRISFRK